MMARHLFCCGLALALVPALNRHSQSAPFSDIRKIPSAGHSRPRALAYNPRDGLLYAALSTADSIAVMASNKAMDEGRKVLFAEYEKPQAGAKPAAPAAAAPKKNS